MALASLDELRLGLAARAQAARRAQAAQAAQVRAKVAIVGAGAAGVATGRGPPQRWQLGRCASGVPPWVGERWSGFHPSW